MPQIWAVKIFFCSAELDAVVMVAKGTWLLQNVAHRKDAFLRDERCSVTLGNTTLSERLLAPPSHR